MKQSQHRETSTFESSQKTIKIGKYSKNQYQDQQCFTPILKTKRAQTEDHEKLIDRMNSSVHNINSSQNSNSLPGSNSEKGNNSLCQTPTRKSAYQSNKKDGNNKQMVISQERQQELNWDGVHNSQFIDQKTSALQRNTDSKRNQQALEIKSREAEKQSKRPAKLEIPTLMDSKSQFLFINADINYAEEIQSPEILPNDPQLLKHHFIRVKHQNQRLKDKNLKLRLEKVKLTSSSQTMRLIPLKIQLQNVRKNIEKLVKQKELLLLSKQVQNGQKIEYSNQPQNKKQFNSFVQTSQNKKQQKLNGSTFQQNHNKQLSRLNQFQNRRQFVVYSNKYPSNSPTPQQTIDRSQHSDFSRSQTQTQNYQFGSYIRRQ